MTTMRISVTLLLLVGMALANNKCNEEFSPYGHHSFKYFEAAKTWGQAEQACLALGGNLASVHSAEEYSFVRNLIKTSAPSEPAAWIGGSNTMQLDMWFWSDGSKFNWLNWCQGEPNNVGGNEHCLSINWCVSKKWNDLGCSSILPYVCAKRTQCK